MNLEEGATKVDMIIDDSEKIILNPQYR